MKYISISQAAKELKVSRPTVYQLIADGRLTVYRNPAYRPKYSPVGIPFEQITAIKEQANTNSR